MTLQTITVNLPERLYRQVRQRAQDRNRSIEDELASVVEDALRVENIWTGIDTNIAEEAQQLRFLDDEHLWRVAQMSMPAAKSNKMQILSQKQQAEGLKIEEQAEVKQLQYFARRVMLLRAEAAVLLQERGYDVSNLRQVLPAL